MTTLVWPPEMWHPTWGDAPAATQAPAPEDDEPEDDEPEEELATAARRRTARA